MPMFITPIVPPRSSPERMRAASAARDPSSVVWFMLTSFNGVGSGRGSEFGVDGNPGTRGGAIKLWSLFGQAPWVCRRSSGTEDTIVSYVQSYGHLS